LKPLRQARDKLFLWFQGSLLFYTNCLPTNYAEKYNSNHVGSMSATNKSRVVPTSELRANQSVVHPKKAEGRDLLRSTVRSNYEQTITDLKNRPTAKSNEEEYINGLQEEIKFLEYQLKLLKDKELAERGSLNELDNFLKDEIPINENILAMKNKYNTTKQTLEGQFKKLSSDNE